MTNDNGQKPLPGFQSPASVLPEQKRPSQIALRVHEAAIDIDTRDSRDIVFQHTVLCQTCLPYRDPGDAVRVWDRENGLVSLRVRAGEAKHPERGWVEVGLPFGPKPRLIVCYLNTVALQQHSPVIEVENSLTAFVKEIGLDTGGRTLNMVKDQLARLSAADLKLGFTTGPETAKTFKGQIISEFDLWFPRNEKQRVLWPTSIKLSLDYYTSLMQHAVPLDQRAVGALSHSAMGLDIYAWLAQRLHRVHQKADSFVAWKNIKDQFGFAYSTMGKFKQVFRIALGQVLAVYPEARIALDGRGITLRNSPPPIVKRVYTVPKIG